MPKRAASTAAGAAASSEGSAAPALEPASAPAAAAAGPAPAGGAPAKAKRAKKAPQPAAPAVEPASAPDAADPAPAVKAKRAKKAPAAPALEPASAPDAADPAPTDGGGGGGGAPAEKAKRAKKAPLAASPHAGPDPAGMAAGPFLPAASMAAFTASLPARAPGGVKILCYNVNGLRGAVKEERKAALLAWVAREDPDVLCLQEVKADAEAVEKERLGALFPTLPHAFFACGDPALAGFKKGYAGCAVFSKVAPLATAAGLGAAAHDGQGRVATARFAWGTVVCVYAPNSGQKLERLEYRTGGFDPALRAHLAGLAGGAGGGAAGAPLIVCGDFNVAHQDCDVEGYLRHRNKVAGFCDGERDGFAQLLAAGFRDAWRDANPGVLQYSALPPPPPPLAARPTNFCPLTRVPTHPPTHPPPSAAYYSTRQVTARAENKGWRVDYALAANCAPVVEMRHSFPGSDHLPFSITLA
jgi:exodeoxyribonuclease-3